MTGTQNCRHFLFFQSTLVVQPVLLSLTGHLFTEYQSFSKSHDYGFLEGDETSCI